MPSLINFPVLILLSLLVGCAPVLNRNVNFNDKLNPWVEAGSLHPIIVNTTHTNPLVRGVWRSRGYGRILRIDENSIEQYEIGKFCFRPERASKNLSAMDSVNYRYYRLLPDGKRAIFQLLRGDTNVVFDKLERLPSLCLKEAKTDPESVAEVFLDTFERHYAFFDRRLPGHLTRAARVHEQVNSGMTDNELWDVLALYMDGLSDSHTKLVAEIDGERRRVQDGQGVTLPMVRASDGGEKAWLVDLITQTKQTLGSSAHHTGRDRIIWGLVGGKVGYLQIFQMGGFTNRNDFGSDIWAQAELTEFNRIMDEAFDAFQDANVDGVILDLSNNRGGWDQIAKAIPGRFTDTAYTGFTTAARGSGLAPFPHIIKPSQGPRFLGPVYVMTSDVTVSGGELAMLALRQNPNVVQVGETTRGAFSTPLAKRLPNGWLLELSNENFAAPDGNIYEEHGLKPSLPLNIYPANAPVQGHGNALRHVAELIASK